MPQKIRKMTVALFELHHEKTHFLHILCENKGTDQLRGNHAADQRLCSHYIDSTIPLLLTGFVMTWLILPMTYGGGAGGIYSGAFLGLTASAP